MHQRKALCATSLTILIFVCTPSIAQTPRRGAGRAPAASPRTSAKPTPPATARGAAPAAASTPLAVVNNQTITFADIDPRAQQVVASLPQEIINARRRLLDAQINALLFQAEAKRRNVTIEQLLDVEVNQRVVYPTEDEIKAFYDTNRDSIGAADLQSVRTQIINYIRNERAQKLAADFANRLRTTHAVKMGVADVNAPNLPPSTALASVDGQTVTAGFLDERLKPFIYQMQMQVYETERNAVDAKINDYLLNEDAKRRKTTPQEIVEAEIIKKTGQPTDADIMKFYEQNKEQLGNNFEVARPQIIELLKQQEQARLESQLAQNLRKGAAIRILFSEPNPPVQAISTDDDPARGDLNAPVTVVMFTDFQCPACAAVHPILDGVLKTYGNRVRFVVRDFPLPQHAQARKAAEAADAANAQGKFFEYIDILFKNQSMLDVESLKRYASQLGLDRKRFDVALDSGMYAAEVNKDVADGEIYGVDSTPTIFINGVRLKELTAAAMVNAIDRALAQANRAANKQAK
jgi:protein-disulfide isomerase